MSFLSSHLWIIFARLLRGTLVWNSSVLKLINILHHQLFLLISSSSDKIASIFISLIHQKPFVIICGVIHLFSASFTPE